MKSKLWVIGFLMLTIISLAIVAGLTIRIDPFFHYHKPDISEYFYPLYNQRSQNDGISKNFDYEGLITGTSMTENFRTSDAENAFGCSFIKVPYSGGTYKEINDNLKVALKNNSNLRIIIRGLDMSKFVNDKDAMRTDLGVYPTYLYNDNPLDDVYYIFNRDVFKKVYEMIVSKQTSDFQPGITSFDDYSNWMNNYTFGLNTLYPNGVLSTEQSKEQEELSASERNMVLENIRQNVTSLAEQYPNVTFYYFFTPYSAGWWQREINEGKFNKQLQTERIVVEEILKTDNIKLFSFNNLTEITSDLNNYKDVAHYGEWVNSLIIRYMKDDIGLLTKENYEEYLSLEKEIYNSFEYQENFMGQEDYDKDYYKAALLDEEIYGIKPYYIKEGDISASEIKNAQIITKQHNNCFVVMCKGTLDREPRSEISVSEYIWKKDEFDGFRITIDDIGEYRYLFAYGKKITDHGQPSIIIYDENGKVLGETSVTYKELDGEWHQYIVDVSSMDDKVEIVFHGGYTDATGSDESKFAFSEIALY